MIQFCTYDTTTGRIRPHTASSEDLMDEQVQPGEALWDGELDANTTYMVDGVPTDRPLLSDAVVTIAADGVESWHLTDVPAGTVIVQMDGLTVYTVDDGEFEFTTCATGVTTFRVKPPFPWQPQLVTVTAHG